MISGIIEVSLRQRAAVILGSLVLLGFGLWSALDLPVDAVPDITQPQVQVNTSVAALAPEEAELLVTRVLEQELAGLPGVDEMRSLTKFGLSQITLQFHDGTDIYRSRQLVTERINAVREQLPTGTEPRLAPISTGLGEIFYYTLSWATNSPSAPIDATTRLLALQEAQEYVAKPFLRATPGVAEINTIGGLVRQHLIEPDPEKLRAANLTFDEFATLVARNAENAGGGVISREGRRLLIRAATRPGSESELADLPVRFAGAVEPLRVRELARVSIGSAVRTGAATGDGEETVLGTVMMLAGENSRIVAHRVAGRLDALRERLPKGVVLQVELDRSALVDRTVGTVRRNLFEGALFVVAVLLALLGNLRAALVVALTIPLSFLCALIGMSRLGISGNLMSLGALDFGLIIDGAVVVVENVVRQLAHRQAHLGRPLDPEERARTVLAASKQVATPVFFGVLIIAVVYLPILALTGIEGRMFRPMALTVMLALGAALVLSLTLMPVLCSLCLGGRISEEDNAAVRFLRRLYARTLDFVLPKPVPVSAGALVLFGVSLVAFTRLGAEFVPKLDEGTTTMMLYRPVGQSLEASVADQLKTDRLVREAFPEVVRVFSRIGTAEVATDPMPPNEADFYVDYRPRAEWRAVDGRIPTKRELAQRIAESIRANLTNTDVLVAQPIEMRFNEMLEGVRADLSVKVFGPDFDVLEPAAEKIRDLLAAIPGATEVEFETDGRTPILTLEPKRDALLRRNVGGDVINGAVATALAGRTVAALSHGTHQHDVVVRLGGDLRSEDSRIRSLPVRVGDDGMVPLGELVDLKVVDAVEPIRRDDGKRRAALMVNLDTPDVEGWVEKARATIAREVPLPEGYAVEFGGQFSRLREARARLMVVVPAALALIFGLVFMTFGSLRQAMLVYSGIPLAVTGGIAALWLRGMPFSITAAVGFIALSGVAVLNGVVMVSCFNDLREEGMDVFSAVRDGALARLRPVLMTAFVAALGFVPMAVATGAGAEVQQPLATVVIGGIVSSTLLTLVVLPVLYRRVEKDRKSTA